MRAGVAVAQQHLHDAHPVDHGDGGLETAVAAALERCLRGFQRGLRREELDAVGRVGGHRHRHDQAERPGELHFFLMKKVNSFSSSACESSSCPVWREKVWKSFTEPGSVASTLSTSPGCMPVSAFLV